jgi:hypothetical protein
VVAQVRPQPEGAGGRRDRSDPSGRQARGEVRPPKQPQTQAKLAPGDYTLVVEAAREVGGRELVKIPFSWPAKAPQIGQGPGQGPNSALVTLAVKP